MNLGSTTGHEALKELCPFYKGRAVNLVEFSSHVKWLVQLLEYFFSFVNSLCEIFCSFGYSFHWLSQVVVEIKVS